MFSKVDADKKMMPVSSGQRLTASELMIVLTLLALKTKQKKPHQALLAGQPSRVNSTVYPTPTPQSWESKRGSERA